MSDPKNWKAGYKRPPRKTQFRKGQSGNPKGRPKGSFNLDTFLRRELAQKITIKEGGIPIRVTKAELIAKRTVEKAANGDIRALLFVYERGKRSESSGSMETHDHDRDDDKLLEEFVRREAQRLKASKGDDHE